MKTIFPKIITVDKKGRYVDRKNKSFFGYAIEYPRVKAGAPNNFYMERLYLYKDCSLEMAERILKVMIESIEYGEYARSRLILHLLNS